MNWKKFEVKPDGHSNRTRGIAQEENAYQLTNTSQ